MKYLILLEGGEWGAHYSIPVAVVPDIDTAMMVCNEMGKNDGNEFNKYALSVVGGGSIEPDSSFRFMEIGEISL